MPCERVSAVLIGWDVVDTSTDTVEDFVALSPDLVALRGYVDAVERGYETTRWHLERVLRIEHA